MSVASAIATTLSNSFADTPVCRIVVDPAVLVRIVAFNADDRYSVIEEKDGIADSQFTRQDALESALVQIHLSCAARNR